MITDYIRPTDIKMNLEGEDREECFAELLEIIMSKQPDINRSEVMEALVSREEKSSTAVFSGIAVPHAVCKSVKKPAVAIGVCSKGIEFDSLELSTYNYNKVKIIFEILFGENDSEEHLHILRDVLKLSMNPDFLTRILDARSSQDAFDVIAELE